MATYHKCIQIKHNQRLTCQRTIWVLPLARDILINPSLFAFQNKLISKDLSFSDLLRITPKKPPHDDFTDFRDPLRLHAFPFILSNLGRSSWYDPDCSFTSFCKLQRHFVGSPPLSLDAFWQPTFQQSAEKKLRNIWITELVTSLNASRAAGKRLDCK